MSGYARRQGAPPLSRTRSLVVPDGFGYGKGKCTNQGPSGAPETRFGGDKLEDLEEANPFSFKEFLKTKNLSLSKEDTTTSRIYPKVHLGSCQW
uniref:Isoform 6 of Endosome-associated-trafficking regulator 1 n=1 Tax=Mus musculus TaxID=10090 RepID=A2AIW0-6